MHKNYKREGENVNNYELIIIFIFLHYTNFNEEIIQFYSIKEK